MKVKQLLEATPAGLDLVKIIKAKCLSNFNFISSSDVHLYRGVGHQAMSSLYFRSFSPSKEINITWSDVTTPRVRKDSLTNVNLLKNFVDVSDQWSKFPKRGESTLTSADRNHADNFGDIHLVIPYDSVKKFGAMKCDFNDHGSDSSAWIETAAGIRYLFDYCSRLMTLPTFKDYSAVVPELGIIAEVHDTYRSYDRLSTNTMESIIKVSDALTNLISSIDYLNSKVLAQPEKLKNPMFLSYFASIRQYLGYIEKDIRPYESLIDYFTYTWSPEAAGARLLTDISQVQETDEEVWFAGPHLIISAEIYSCDELIEFISKKF